MVSLSLSLSLSSPGSQSHVARVSSSSRGPRCAGGQPRSALCQSRVSSGDISSSPTCRQDNLSATGNPAIYLRAATTRTSHARSDGTRRRTSRATAHRNFGKRALARFRAGILRRFRSGPRHFGKSCPRPNFVGQTQGDARAAPASRGPDRAPAGAKCSLALARPTPRPRPPMWPPGGS